MSTNALDNKYAVLYVDDEEQALKYFRKGLERDFRILTAANVPAAREILDRPDSNVGVVITDQKMPGPQGTELLAYVRQHRPNVVRILVTAYSGIENAVAAVNDGAIYKYITKPADFALLRQCLSEGLAMHRESVHRDTLADTVRQLEEQCARTHEAEAQRGQLQRKLIEASRQAGRAEVATGILHNVGNLMNSMNVSADLLATTLQQSKLANLRKGLAMFEEHAADLAAFLTTDSRGKALPGYLAKLGTVLADEHALIAKELASLAGNIEHIGRIVQMQQSYATQVFMPEPASAAALADEAIRVNAALLEGRGVSVERDYADLPALLLDRHRVLQILINLVSNAAKAVDESSGPKRVTIRTRRIDADGGPRVRFEVIDCGAGIAPENLTRVFTFGFTTRAEGHGFGLHSSANAAREMGGSLAAASEGPGRGATFTLDLPLVAEGAAGPVIEKEAA